MNDPNFSNSNPQNNNVSISIIEQLYSSNEFVNQNDNTMNLLNQIICNSQSQNERVLKTKENYISRNEQNKKCLKNVDKDKLDKNKQYFQSSESQINLQEDSQFFYQQQKKNKNQNNQKSQNKTFQKNVLLYENNFIKNEDYSYQYSKELQNNTNDECRQYSLQAQNQSNQLSKLDFIKKLQSKLDVLQKRISIKRNANSFLEQYKQNVQNDYHQFSLNQSLHHSSSSQTDLFQSKSLQNNNISECFLKMKKTCQKQNQVQADPQNFSNKKFQEKLFLIQIPTQLITQNNNQSEKMSNKSSNNNQIYQSHYFVQNDEINSIITGIDYDLKQKNMIKYKQKQKSQINKIQRIHHSNSIIQSSFNSKIRKNSDLVLSSLVYSSGIVSQQYQNNILKSKQIKITQNFQQLQDESILSHSQNENSISFLRKIKSGRSHIQIEQNQQLISNLLTKITQNHESEEIQKRLNELLQQNLDLKEKVKQNSAQIQFLSQKNMNFWQEKQSIEEQYLKIRHQCQYYLQQTEYIKQEFSEKMATAKIETKNHYQQIINQLQNQQAQYAQRIITLQEMLQQKIESQKTLQKKIIESQCQADNLRNQLIIKEQQINSFQGKQKDLITIHGNKQLCLKQSILKLEEQNNQLINILKLYKNRQEQEGIFVLCAQAQQIKEAIQNKENVHHQKLQQVQNKYLKVIKIYQDQIQMLKQKAEIVTKNKSTSIKSDLNKQSSIYPTSNKSNLKKRESIRSTRITTMSTFKDTIQCNSYQYDQSLQNQLSNYETSVNTSLEIKQKMEDAHRFKYFYLKNLNMGQFESCQDENIYKEQIQRLNSQNLTPHSMNFNQIQPQQKLSLKRLFENTQDKIELQLFLTKLIHQNEYLEDLIQKQRREKIKLTNKLKIFQIASFKYISQLEQNQKALIKNEQLFQQITLELEKQYKVNKKLKKKLIQLSENQYKFNNQIDKNTNDIQKITLKKKDYQKMLKENKNLKKYAKILQNQFSEINSLQDCEIHNYFIISLQNFIEQNLQNHNDSKVQKLASLQFMNKQKQMEISVNFFNKKRSKNKLISNIIKLDTFSEKASTFDLFSKKIIKHIQKDSLTLQKLINYSIGIQKLSLQYANNLNQIKLQLSLKVIQFAQQKIKQNKKLLPISPDKIILSRFCIGKNNIVHVQLLSQKETENTTKQFQNEKQLAYIYDAPQILLGIGYTESSYVWTVGLIIDQIFHKKPFYKKIEQIVSHKENYAFIDQFEKYSILNLKELVQKMVKKNHKNRICLKQARQKLRDIYQSFKIQQK